MGLESRPVSLTKNIPDVHPSQFRRTKSYIQTNWLKILFPGTKKVVSHGGQLDLGVPELSGTTWKKAAKLQPAVSYY